LPGNGGGFFTFSSTGLAISSGGQGEIALQGTPQGGFTLTSAESLRQAVPEPATLALFVVGVGLVALSFGKGRKQGKICVT
jgi:hypothetical protein